jgi:hypothetical protein
MCEIWSREDTQPRFPLTSLNPLDLYCRVPSAYLCAPSACDRRPKSHVSCTISSGSCVNEVRCSALSFSLTGVLLSSLFQLSCVCLRYSGHIPVRGSPVMNLLSWKMLVSLSTSPLLKVGCDSLLCGIHNIVTLYLFCFLTHPANHPPLGSQTSPSTAFLPRRSARLS